MNAELEMYRAMNPDTDDDMLAMDLQLDVALEVERLMEHEGITRTELSDRIESSRPYITKVLSGDANMTLKTLAKLANALGRRVKVAFTHKGSRARWIEVIETNDSVWAQADNDRLRAAMDWHDDQTRNRSNVISLRNRNVSINAA